MMMRGSRHSRRLRHPGRRTDEPFSRRGFLTGMAASAALGFGTRVFAQPRPAASGEPSSVLFTNVRLFDGLSAALRDGVQVLVNGNRIEAVASGNEPAPAGTRTIDCGRRVLMPGLIDAHWHCLLVAPGFLTAMTSDTGYLNVMAAKAAEATLLRGFTSVRDMGGPAFGLKRSIDEGLIAGPRIYPSGAMITQTSGHGDFRQLNEIPRTAQNPLSHPEQIGASAIADGVAEVLRRVREQLMLGASQIKLTAGGGVASPHSPIDVAAFTEAELRAAVEATSNWGTYVATHAYTSPAIQVSLAAGVQCIEHGHLMDEATARLMADRGTWLSTQPFLDDDDVSPMPSAEARKKFLTVVAGTDRVYALAKKYRIKTAWGTDILFDARLASRQGAQLAKMVRWYTATEALKMATSANADLLALSGERNPYPGKLGVIEKGALADVLLVDGDPTADLKVIVDYEKNLRLIMKDGRIHKNTI